MNYSSRVWVLLHPLCKFVFCNIFPFSECDPGLREAVATLIWCAPRLSYDCQELNVLKDQFMVKYGKEFCQACLSNANHDVNPKVMQKLNVKAPPANLCEAYLVEIAKSYDVEFTPDTNLLCSQPKLVDLGEPPELPNYNFFDDGFINPTPMGPGVPYPPPLNPEDVYNEGIPSLPPQSGPNYNGTLISPAYVFMLDF